MKPKSLQQFESNHDISPYSPLGKATAPFRDTMRDPWFYAVLSLVAVWFFILSIAP